VPTVILLLNVLLWLDFDYVILSKPRCGQKPPFLLTIIKVVQMLVGEGEERKKPKTQVPKAHGGAALLVGLRSKPDFQLCNYCKTLHKSSFTTIILHGAGAGRIHCLYIQTTVLYGLSTSRPKLGADVTFFSEELIRVVILERTVRCCGDQVSRV